MFPWDIHRYMLALAWWQLHPNWALTELRTAASLGVAGLSPRCWGQGHCTGAWCNGEKLTGGRQEVVEGTVLMRQILKTSRKYC